MAERGPLSSTWLMLRKRPRLLTLSGLGLLAIIVAVHLQISGPSLAREHDTCIVLVDHSPARTAALCDRVLNFRRGRLVEDEPGLIRLPMLGGDN